MSTKHLVNQPRAGRWLILLIALLTTPLGLRAQESYGLTVAGVAVTSDNASSITGANITSGTVSFDASTNTLTLNGATVTGFTSTNGCIVTSRSELKIAIIGENTLDCSGDTCTTIRSTLSTLQGGGTLTFVKGGDHCSLTLKGGYAIHDFASVSVAEGLYWDKDYTYENGITHFGSGMSLRNPVGQETYSTEATNAFLSDAQPLGLTVGGVEVTTWNADNVMGDYHHSVSYNASTKTLTLKGANLSSRLSGVKASDNTKLTVYLIGYNQMTGGQDEQWNNLPCFQWGGDDASVTFKTNESFPGTLDLNYCEVATVTPVYENGLGNHDKVICVPQDDTSAYSFAGYVSNEGNHDFMYARGGDFHVSYVDFNGSTPIISTKTDETTAAMWPTSLNTSSLKKVTFQFDKETCANQNVTVQIRGIVQNHQSLEYESDGKTYSKAISLSKADPDGIVEIPLNKLVTSDYIQLYFSSTEAFSFVPLSIGFTDYLSYGISVCGTTVNELNAADVLGDGKVSYNAETHTLTLNNATIGNGGTDPQPMEAAGVDYTETANLTISLTGTNTIYGMGGCEAIRYNGNSDSAPKLIFTKAGEQPASLQMETTNYPVIDGFSEVEHEGLFMIEDQILGTDVPDTNTVLVSSTLLGGGSGTAADPLLIKTKEDLTTFAYYICNNKISNNVNVKLNNDIDCGELTNFAPIGYGNYFFDGTFDGNGMAIKNLTIADDAGACVGLFRILGENGMIKDLTIENLTLSGGNSSSNDIGGLVGILNGGTVSNCMIKNSTISCKTNSLSPTVGALVGALASGSITNSIVQACTVNAVTQDTSNSGPVAQAGGIVGNAYGGTITGCQVKETTTVKADYGEYSATVSAGAIVARKDGVTLSNNTYEYSVTTSTNKYDGTTTHLTTKSGYEQRGIGGQTYNGQTQQNEDNPDLFDGNGAVMYTKKVTLPAESDQATVIGEEGTYYSTVMESDVQSILVAPGQTATLNAIPGDGLAIASLTVTNTTTSEAISTTATVIEGNEMQYTFTMPDAPVTVAVTAATAYGVTVGSVAVTELNYSDVLGDGKVSWDNTKHILTMNGATIDGGIRCSLDGALTVLLQGQNVIDGGYENANRNGARAFEGESQTTSLVITTDTDNPGQLLLKGTFVNQWDNAEYYSNNMYPSFNNGLVASQSNSDKKMLIAQGPVVTPGEGLYWTGQQYTIPTGTQISCSDNAGRPVDVSVNANSFTLTGTGKYTISISKAVTVDDTNFSLSNSGYYIVHKEPGFSAPAGTYTDSKTITLTNLPTLSETTDSYPQVWYYLDDNKNDSVLYTSVEQEITLTESTKVCVYIIDEDSGKVVKSANVEAEYTILKTPDYHFSDDPTGHSSYPNGSTVYNLNFGQENTLPWLIDVPNGLAITYRSSDEATATIDQEGHITLTGAGHVWIYASNEETDDYVAHTDSIRLEIRPMDPQTSIAQGAYYTGQKLELISTVPNGEMYYRYSTDEEKVKYTEPLTLAKGKWEIYFYTKCGSGNDEMWSYGNNHPTYYVYDELTFTPESGTTSNDNITVEIGNLPSSTPNAASIFYFFGEDDEDDTNDLEYNTTDKVNVAESTKVTAYIKVEGDSGKVYKTEPVEAEYVIRTVPEMSFVSNNKPVEVAEWTIGGTENQPLPTLKNELQLQVTYSSTQTDVATVDNNGSVTPVGVGETSITATSTQTDIYQSTVTSYQLHVYKMLNHESITIEAIDDQPYTGAPIEPTVTVKDGQQTLSLNEDYSVSYAENHTNVGAVTVTITAIDQSYYKGSATTSFNIVNRTLVEGKDVTFANGQSWASYFTNSETLEVPEGIVAYVLTGVNGGTLTVQAISKVPKNIPVLLEKTNNAVTTNDTYDVNLLRGTAEATSVTGIEGVVYVLYNGEFVRTKSGTIPAHRAYLVLSSDAGARLSIGFDDEATGIRNLEADGNGNDVWFSLDGQRFDKKPAKKGLYIHNGEKEFVK